MITDALINELVQRYHTPLYIFEEDIVRRQCRALKEAVTYPKTVIRYACKALTLRAVLQIVRDEGLWIDAVSINEVHRALRAGFVPEEILYTGEGASEQVYSELLERGVLINCSSLDQMRLIGRIRRGSRCSIRVNPGEGHGANTKTNTGGPASKHGIYFDQMEHVQSLAEEFDLTIIGLHSHIGSGTDIKHWLRIKDLTLKVAGCFKDLEFVDLGGGLPIVYNPQTDEPIDLAAWGKQLSDGFEAFCRDYGRELTLQIEPGRYVVAECGQLIAEVQTVKSTPDYNYAVVNTGLNHNPRPAMYGSFHPIRFIQTGAAARSRQAAYVIAGNLCESGDVFTVGSDGTLLPRVFPEIRVGDLMVMGHIGAYSHAMKSEYNSMNLPASVLVASDGTALTPEEATDILGRLGLRLDGASLHCLTYVHGVAATGTKAIRPFIPKELRRASARAIEDWCYEEIIKVMDFAVAMKVRTLPMFWGINSFELASGYPWGFFAWKDAEDPEMGYDLRQEFLDWFVTHTANIRKAANDRELLLCHEIHPGTAAMTAQDFVALVKHCDNDPCLKVNGDPSHCWEGEDWLTRTNAVAPFIYATHVKAHRIQPGLPLRSFEPDWKKRAMQFTPLHEGNIDLVAYSQALINAGYPQRYCALHGCSTAPLVVEAESAYDDGDWTSAEGIRWVAATLCRPAAAGSFEDSMGAAA